MHGETLKNEFATYSMSWTVLWTSSYKSFSLRLAKIF